LLFRLLVIVNNYYLTTCAALFVQLSPAQLSSAHDLQGFVQGFVRATPLSALAIPPPPPAARQSATPRSSIVYHDIIIK
jgi:hypothetical protein